MCHSSWETAKAGLHCHRLSCALHKPTPAPGGANRLRGEGGLAPGHGLRPPVPSPGLFLLLFAQNIQTSSVHLLLL